MAEHSRCQPGRPGPHGVSQNGSPGLAAFHSAKSRGSRFSATVGHVVGAAHLVHPLAGQLAVLRVGLDLEVHVTTGRIGVPGVDQALHQRDHFGHVPGRARLDVRRQAAQQLVGLGESALVALGHHPPGVVLLLGHANYLVVDIGDIAAENDPVAAGFQPSHENVERESSPQMTDMWRRLDRGPTDVQRYLPRNQGREFAYVASLGVVEAQGHAAQATGLYDLNAQPLPARIRDHIVARRRAWPGQYA